MMRYRAEGAATPTDQDALILRAAAMLPTQLLQPGELIILLLKPSPWFIVLAPLRTLIAIAAITTAAIYANDAFNLGAPQRDLVLVGVALIGARLFWQFLEWLSRAYVLTDQRMVAVAGVLRISIVEARLAQIQHTRLDFSVRERFFNLGSIAFATAGTAFHEAWWEMIAHPLDVHRVIVNTLRRYKP
ncbi:MAG: PH domain-containing protein [Phycisphaeraceae bacterium]